MGAMDSMVEGWMDAMERCRGIETAPCFTRTLAPFVSSGLLESCMCRLMLREKNDSCWVWEGNLT